jgi:hypothetical protein
MNWEIIVLAIITAPIWVSGLLFIIYLPLFLLYGSWVATIDVICTSLKKAQKK